METLFIRTFVNGYLAAIGKSSDSLNDKDKVTSDDFIAMAQILKICEERKKQLDTDA